MMTNRFLIVVLVAAASGCMDEAETPHAPVEPGQMMDTSGRVVDSLQVLYKFDEGKGFDVKDQSNVGTPFDLHLDNLLAQRWVPGGGVEILGESGAITSLEVADKVFSACVQANAISLEVWVEPANDTQTGTIFTYSKQNQRNARLSVNTTRYTGEVTVSREDATMPDMNGLPTIETKTEYIQTPDSMMAVSPTLQHIVYTRDGMGQALYLNGGDTKPSTTGTTTPPTEPEPIFDMTEWSPTYQLSLGDETSGGSPWMGKIYMAAVYCKKLSLLEVNQNFKVGPQF